MSTTPTITTPDELIRALQWRYAVKKFDATRKIPTNIWSALEQALVLTPSSFGMQPWKFFVVTNQGIKDRLVTACWNQRQVADASHVVVMAAPQETTVAEVERYMQRIAEVRNVPLSSLDGFKKILTGFVLNPPKHVELSAWAEKQIYIALGNFMTSAAVLGIDVCPMEGFEPDKVNGVLGLAAQGYTAVVLAPAGYRAADDKYAQTPKVRYKSEEVIEHLD